MFVNIYLFLTLYKLAISNNFLSTDFIPDKTLVYIIGKHISILVNIATLEDLNHTKAIIMIDITGVAFIITIKGSNNSSIKTFIPAIIPKLIPNAIDIRIPVMTLNILLNTLIQKYFLASRIIKVSNTFLGDGSNISLFIKRELISHIKTQNIIIKVFLTNLEIVLFSFIVEIFIW
ncbi:hypothetical protein UT300006_33490 [Clostridium sp. CTA-6]